MEWLVAAAIEAGRLDDAARLARTGRERALVFAARGDLDAARAAVLEDRPDGPFELGRTLLALGRIERRAKRRRASRAALERAAALFAGIPDPRWEARAHAELLRLGTPARPGELTETQRRIAELAAAGYTNPEIAARVFVARKTVEANLTEVYRKLGVRSRVDLARRYAYAVDP